MSWKMALQLCCTLVLLCFVLNGDATSSRSRWPSINKLKSSTSADTQQKAVEDMLQRLIGNRSSEFIVLIDRHFGPPDRSGFRLESINQNRIKVTGNTGVAAALGVQTYLKQWVGCHVSWSGNQLNLPKVLPKIAKPVQVNANDKLQYYQNVCTTSYSFVWWTWERWEKEIDWMALNGINLPLAFSGQELIWSKIYTELGFTLGDLAEFFTGPAFLAWNRMGNVDGWGGPLTFSWQRNQLNLQKRILNRMQSFGMVPVLPAFSGHVPRATLKRYPHANVTQLSRWGSFNDTYCCTYLLDPSDPLFQRIGTRFLQVVKILFQDASSIYNCDAFNEMTPPSGDVNYVRNMSIAIYQAMHSVDENAVWLMQAWLFNDAYWTNERARALLTAVPLGKMIVLDLQAEINPKYKLFDSFFGQPFIWCMLHNFGGVLGLYGAAQNVNLQIFEARTSPNSTMVGTGLTPEGIEQNDVMYEFMNEMTIRKKPVNIPKWFANYADRRYGQRVKEVEKAWMLMSRTIYNCTDGHKQHGGYVIVKRPNLKLTPPLWYAPVVIFDAWKNILAGSQDLHDVSTYLYDVTDITREALQTLANVFYVSIVSGFGDKNATQLQYGGDKLQELFQDLDEILAADYHFLLGPWLESAKAQGTTGSERNVLEYNARNQITLWGPDGNVLDYAAKQWSGLVSHYYAPRWKLFVDMLQHSIASKLPFNQTVFKQTVFEKVEEPFTFDRSLFPTAPSGDTIEISTRLFNKWRPQVDLSALYKIRRRYKKRLVTKRKVLDHLSFVNVLE